MPSSANRPEVVALRTEAARLRKIARTKGAEEGVGLYARSLSLEREAIRLIKEPVTF